VSAFLDHAERHRHKPADLDDRPSEQILDALQALIDRQARPLRSAVG
jgi:hypothetical protein